jgi:hypothetical protein
MISSAVAAHSNGTESSFHEAMYLLIESMRRRTEPNVPRRIAWRVIIPNLCRSKIGFPL